MYHITPRNENKNNFWNNDWGGGIRGYLHQANCSSATKYRCHFLTLLENLNSTT